MAIWGEGESWDHSWVPTGHLGGAWAPEMAREGLGGEGLCVLRVGTAGSRGWIPSLGTPR